MPPTRRLAILMLVLTTAAWGLSFPGGKALLLAANAALPERDPWFFSALMIGTRFGIGALVLWLLHPRAFGEMRASEWRQAGHTRISSRSSGIMVEIVPPPCFYCSP